MSWNPSGSRVNSSPGAGGLQPSTRCVELEALERLGGFERCAAELWATSAARLPRNHHLSRFSFMSFWCHMISLDLIQTHLSRNVREIHSFAFVIEMSWPDNAIRSSSTIWTPTRIKSKTFHAQPTWKALSFVALCSPAWKTGGDRPWVASSARLQRWCSRS